MIQRKHRGQPQNDEGVGEQQSQVSNFNQLSRIIPGLFIIAGADAAGDHSDDGKADGHTGQGHKGGQGIAYGIGGNGGRAKAGNKGKQKDFAKLEHAVFQSVGHADI